MVSAGWLPFSLKSSSEFRQNAQRKRFLFFFLPSFLADSFGGRASPLPTFHGSAFPSPLSIIRRRRRLRARSVERLSPLGGIDEWTPFAISLMYEGGLLSAGRQGEEAASQSRLFLSRSFLSPSY